MAPGITLPERDSPRHAGLKVAGGYVLFGVLWIVVSDLAAAWIASTPGQLSTLQTVKGWAFIVLSGVFIYGLVVRTHGQVTELNDDLETAIKQVSILHRILRHNLRNICTIIGGTIGEIERHVDLDGQAGVRRLTSQNERLLDLTRKSHYLRTFLTDEANPAWVYGLASIVADEVAKARREYPQATIHLERPETASVHAHSYIDEAVEELIENAIQHNPARTPTVWVTVEAADEWVTLTVEDDGPGIPEIERSVLTKRYETAMDHSQGLGLWLVQLTIEESNGHFEIDDRPEGGSIVTVRLPAADI